MPFCDLPEEELEALHLEEQQRNAMPASTCGGDGSCSSTAGSCKTQGGASAVRSGAAGNAKGMCHSEGSWGNTKLTWSTGKADGPRIRGAGERRPDQCFKCRVSKPIVSGLTAQPGRLPPSLILLSAIHGFCIVLQLGLLQQALCTCACMLAHRLPCV